MAEVRAPGKASHGGLTPSALARGTRLGRYELLAPIGIGGMAKVWAARQTGSSGFAKVVAIKTILPHLSRESDFERLFVDEARVASLVRHPNVCEIFELGEEGHVLFLVMEWVDGDSLIKLLKPAGELLPIPPRVAARIAAETCAGLHAAHTQVDHDGRALNIVHRDVSPHNVLLSSDGIVKVTDFGVAKAVGQTHDQTVAGQLKGKLEYMSPEQITGARVDGRTDVFGMGGVLYEATTGQQPFASAGDLEVMNKIVEGRLAPPSDLVRGYPPELEAIVMKAMANDPAGRFASADEMKLALEGYLARGGPPATHADVAALLRQRAGAKMDERLDRIRAAMSASPPRNPSHTPSGSGISTSGVIPTNRPPRIAPAPPPLPPNPSLRAAAPAFADRSASPLLGRSAESDEQSGPDSGFNMDTVADLQIPDFLNPGSSAFRPPTPALQASPAHAGTPPTAPAASPLQPAEDADPDSRHYILAAAAGVFVALVLGAVGYMVWRWVSLPKAQSVGVAATSSLAREIASAPPCASDCNSDVRFRVVPRGAVLSVDGVDLPAGYAGLPRLERGHASTLVVRAVGYDSETLRLDESVNGVVDVVLTPTDDKRVIAARESD